MQSYINDRNAFSSFKKAAQLAKTVDDCYENVLLLVVMGSLFPGMISRSDLVAGLKALVKEHAYDPFWFLYAQDLYLQEVSEGEQYLQMHIAKTHEILLNNFKLRYPRLKKIISKFKKNIDERRVLLGQSGKIRLTSLQEFNSMPSEVNRFLFDVASGKWSLNDQKGIIKPSTNTQKIVSSLLVVKGNRLCLKGLYESVWGGKLDRETDLPAVLTALIRSRKTLQDISPAICLEWGKGKNTDMEVFLKIKIGWAVLL